MHYLHYATENPDFDHSPKWWYVISPLYTTIFDVAIKKQSVNVYFNTTPMFHSSQKFPLIFSTILLEPVFNWWQSLRWGQSNDSVVALLHLSVMTEQYSMNKVFSFGLFIFSCLSLCFHVCMYVWMYCCCIVALWDLCQAGSYVFMTLTYYFFNLSLNSGKTRYWKHIWYLPCQTLKWTVFPGSSDSL